VRILLLGSGGRESALAWALNRSGSATDLVCMPGNPGIARTAELVEGDPADPEAVLAVAKRTRPELVVVGPEAPLVAGVGDPLRAAGIKVFGPDAGAARIEGSKSYAKQLMERAGVPTGRGREFTDATQAAAFMDELGPPYVIKADGLAAGKGVVVTTERDAAIDAIDERLVRGAFGDAGSSIVIEEFLDGQETSVIAFCDGSNVIACEPAQDYKRVFDNDAGPNTGGMGSYSPVPACPPDLLEKIVGEILEPLVAQTAADGAPFVGALYAGLALTSKGPKVIEFNARFGDPETQALLPRLESDLVEICMASATGSLEGTKLQWSPDRCVSVVLAPGGYPGAHPTGFEITGIADAEAIGALVFQAGTAMADGKLVTSGGRALAVSALGPSFEAARSLAYDAASKIGFEGLHMRGDIAERAVIAERDG
jgi:phosphoribosylamine--glycine ligase